MAELNLKQITDKLNSEFTGDSRKLVFWYDANADFIEDVDSMELENAKVLHLEKDNQFYIKYFLECEDTENNYLIYAPFSKPKIKDNHLEDMIKYSKEFFADRASLLAVDLGIDEKNKPVIQHYIKFFGNKDRTQRFYDLEIDSFNRANIEIGLMSVLCKIKNSSFEEVVRVILTSESEEENQYLLEFEKYDLLEAFWQQVKINFGYDDENPTLEKLLMTMFATYASKSIHASLPKAWKNFVSQKAGNIIAFMDNLMNSYLYSDNYDKLSHDMFVKLNAQEVLSNLEIGSLIDCSMFSQIDDFIINWMIKRLENEDIGAKIADKNILEACLYRRKKHYGKAYHDEYFIIENAFNLISAVPYHYISGIDDFIKDYMDNKYQIDRRYRYFYYYLDRIEDSSKYEKLRELVENIYTNDYLNKITDNWNIEFAKTNGKTGLNKQTKFYDNYLRYTKERTVVIISDAFRYEVARTLFENLVNDEKCNANITAMQGVLPSYTPLGMASLLPHDTIEYTDEYDVLVDGKACVSTEQRENILKTYKPNSRAVQFDTIKNMKRDDLRDIFTGQDIVYVYHNQIDARGDSYNTENEVFNACEEAVEEIHSLIRRLSSTANTHRFFITADHGFIYKRDRLSINDKIHIQSNKSNSVGQRYVISKTAIVDDGIMSIPIGNVLGNEDKRYVSYPTSSNIFSVPGAGQNFVHGGCSPQEIIVPLIDVKVEKGRTETSTAKIDLISVTNKITNLITSMDFIQTEAISDVVKETKYKVYFVSQDNEIISNENIIIADKKDNDATKRMFRVRFNFKNQKYDINKKYYLVVYDANNDLELLRRDIIMDIACADDFGFFS